MKPTAVIQFSISRLQCTACGAEANASCNCGKPYMPAAQRVREYDEANPGQSERGVAAATGVSKSQVHRTRTPDPSRAAPRGAADASEARCAAQWKAFTAQEERNAVSNVLEAIRDLTDEQRALLFQTLRESYQWT